MGCEALAILALAFLATSVSTGKIYTTPALEYTAVVSMYQGQAAAMNLLWRIVCSL